MVKWIDEKVLQYYFKERFDKYPVTIDGERKTLTSCEFNDNFDKLVLQNEYNRAEICMPYWHYIDTLKIARTLLPKLISGDVRVEVLT